MKYIYLLVAALSFAACSKDASGPEVFDPMHPKIGQEAALFIDHYALPSDQRTFFNAARTASVYVNIDKLNREFGYTYVVKAKLTRTQPGPNDYTLFWFEYTSTISKDKYLGTDTIALPLFSPVPPLAAFYLRKEGDVFYYYGSAPLRPANATVKAAMEEAFTKGTELMMSNQPNTMVMYGLHDPENYSKGYVVYRVTL